MESGAKLYRVSPFIAWCGAGLSNLLTGKTVGLSRATWCSVLGLGDRFTLPDVERQLGLSHELATSFLARLIGARLVLPDDESVFANYAVRYVDIEITSHCNARCRFCPVSADPLPRRFMPRDVFLTVLSRLEGYPVKWVALNHYNEPLLDPDFLEKVRLLDRSGLALRLFTNGMLLRPEISDELSAIGNVESIIVNIPTDNPREYEERMGVRMLPGLLSQVRYAAAKGLRVVICINGTDQISQRWAKTAHGVLGESVHVHLNSTHDRAGHVGGAPEVQEAGHWSGPLMGCRRALEHLHVNVDGWVYLCCQDYHQQHLLGDVSSSSIREIMTGVEAVGLRRRIFGEGPAPMDFICRSCVELLRERRAC